MKEKVVRSADLTAYSSLFRKTYWGGGGPSAEASSPEIIASRNRLVEEYGLQSWFFTPKLMDLNEPGSEYDHPEAYRLSDGRALLLISNYSG